MAASKPSRRREWELAWELGQGHASLSHMGEEGEEWKKKKKNQSPASEEEGSVLEKHSAGPALITLIITEI